MSPFAIMLPNLEGLMLTEINQTERQILHGITCMENLKNKCQVHRNSRTVVARGWGVVGQIGGGR